MLDKIEDFIRANLERLLVRILFALLIIEMAVMADPSGWIGSGMGWLLGIDNSGGDGKHDVLTAIGWGIAGAISLLALFYTGKRADALNATAEAQMLTVQNAEARLTQERLKNAIDHLGSEKVSVRMGGAYEIFLLAKENMSDKDFVQNLLDILCAHICGMTGTKEYQEEYRNKPSGDIQTLLTLIFVQNHAVFKGCRINLQGSYLNGAILTGAKLQKAHLEHAQMQNADLSSAHLQNAKLEEANLDGANLGGAWLKKARFTEANLQNANLSSSRAQHANFWLAQFQNANLSGALLHMADLLSTKLMNANLAHAQLQGAHLGSAILHEADLSCANLQGAFLYANRLQMTNLAYAQLQGARIMGNIRLGTDKIEGLQLHGVVGKESDCPALNDSFEQRMKNRIGKDTDPNGIVLVSAEGEQLATKELLESNGAVAGSYTEEEAERWISEYKDATFEFDDC